MSVLDRLFRRGTAPAPAVAAKEPMRCLHTSCAPQWDSAADMGIEARASRFICSACAESFTAAQFAELRRTEAERVKAALEI